MKFCTVLVCGGRSYGYAEPRATPEQRIKAGLEAQQLLELLDEVSRELPSEGEVLRIVTGDATGADDLATRWARASDVPVKVYRAHWAELGRRAGPIRNQQMLDENRADIKMVLAFPGGKGTADMIRRAKLAGFEVRRVVNEEIQ